jgi:hypothetical protein
MEKRQSREIDNLNEKLSKKDRKLVTLQEKKKGQASASATRRWDNYNKTYAKVEASYLQSFANEIARLEESLVSSWRLETRWSSTRRLRSTDKYMSESDAATCAGCPPSSRSSRLSREAM